jgi:hypothetical protein
MTNGELKYPQWQAPLQEAILEFDLLEYGRHDRH